MGNAQWPECVPFDIEEPQHGLIKLTAGPISWPGASRRNSTTLSWRLGDPSLQAKDQAIARLEAQNETAMLLVVFVAAIALGMLFVNHADKAHRSLGLAKNFLARASRAVAQTGFLKWDALCACPAAMV